jgi:hypothetical protein
MLSPRLLSRMSGVVVLLALSGLAAAQSPTAGPEIGLPTRLTIWLGVPLIVNLILASGLVLLGSDYATKTVADLHANPVGAFAWGLVVGIGVPIALVLVGLTVIGLVITIPGFILLALVGIVGSAVTIVWVGSTLPWTGDTVGANAAISGAVALTIIGAIPLLGGLIIGLLGFCGLGIVGRNLYTSR